MKKSLLFIAAVALAGNFMFTSCGSDDDNKGSKNNTPNMSESDLAEYSVGFQASKDGKPEDMMKNALQDIDANLVSHTPSAADFGSDGYGMVQLFSEVVSADGEDVCYDIDDTKLKMSDVATAGPRKISPEDAYEELKHSLPYEYIRFPYSYDSDKKTYTIANFATFKFNDVYNDAMYVTFTKYPSNPIEIRGSKFGNRIDRSYDNSKYLCRSWKINKIALEAKKNGKSVVAGQEFTTTNLSEIANQIQDKYDVTISSEDRATLKDLGSLRYFTFSHNGRLTFYFTKKIYTGTWSWKNAKSGTIKYEFDKSNMKNAFIDGSGEAKVKFDAKTNELDITGNYVNKSDNAKYTFNSIFNLSPVKTIAK